MDIRPLTGRVLIKRIRTEKIEGIFIAEASKEKSSRGEIIAVGEFEKDKVYNIKQGDVVIFPSWSGTNISFEMDDEYVIIKAEEILAVEENNKEGE